MFIWLSFGCLLMQAAVSAYVNFRESSALFSSCALLISAFLFIQAFNVEEGLTLFVFFLGPLGLINVLLKRN